eukprot:TRINITY_DN1908_c0_g2_i1.p1 TRINITY_DN1908_c0_g2~~TRINITY_DN1908_c0_g2_i1.p1  ORF type:complete len:565 (-),score=96.53 TRINITY_DN1908_c0_g2_i1:89-1729(-)
MRRFVKAPSSAVPGRCLAAVCEWRGSGASALAPPVALRRRWQASLSDAKGRDAFLEDVPRRRSQFDPIKQVRDEQPKFSLADAAESTLAAAAAQQRTARIKLDSITPEHVEEMWPPPALVERPPWATPVKRPRAWLMPPQSLDADFSVPSAPEIGMDDVGRFVPMRRDDLIELLPEGGCGDLAKDLTLVPSPKKPCGLMLRKLTVELMWQLDRLRDATDSSGNPRIDKAGFLIDGKRGVGKSQVLNLLTMWAREQGWLVILEPTPGRYAHDIAEIKRSNNGVYIQNEFAQQFLEATSIFNRAMFEEIPVDLDLYGSRAIDGESLSETRRLYEPLIERTVDQEVADQGLSGVERLRRIAEYKRQVKVPTMVEHLRNPMNLWEIVDFGLNNEAYATQAVAEFFAQLKRQTAHPLLVVVDNWNECFPVSEYVSIRYDNTRYNGYIPAYHLTMPRMFHRWDGGLYRRGLKLCATSWTHRRRRNYRPDLIGVKDHEIRTLRNFSPGEFANYVMHLRVSGVLHNFPREDLEYYFMLTGGNGWEARRVLSTLY